MIMSHWMADSIFRPSDIIEYDEPISIKQWFIRSWLISSAWDYKRMLQSLKINWYPVSEFIESDWAMIDGFDAILSIGKQPKEFRVYRMKERPRVYSREEALLRLDTILD